MKLFTTARPSEKKRKPNIRNGTVSLLISLLAASSAVSAQTISWTDRFEHNVFPTSDQCLNWNNFLDDLANKSFASVTLTGTFDNVGKSINDPALATELARLLSSRTDGSVQVGNEFWTVATLCGTAVTGCGMYTSTGLSVTAGGPESCGCGTSYAVRPGIASDTWGGVNTGTCPGPSQAISLVFNAAVTIDGSTTICQGENTTLTANAVMCTGPYNYLWSNGATTQSITVSEAGDYSVTVTSFDKCVGTSDVVNVSVSGISVDAGEDVTICSDGVELSAMGTAGGGASGQVSKYCVYDAPGGLGNCSFRENLCSAGDGSERFTNNTFSQPLSGSRPDSINVKLYYSANDISTFTVFLNDKTLGSPFIEDNPTGECETVKDHQYPRILKFALDKSSGWNDGGVNTVYVKVSSALPILIAGVVVETVYSNETYSWSPTTGLDDPSVSNPTASPTETTTYTVTFSDANHCIATDEVTVTVSCDPVAVCKPVTAKLEANCQPVVTATDFDNGSSSPMHLPLEFTITPGPYVVGENEIILTVTDPIGGSSTCTTILTVVDPTLPIITPPADITVTNDPGACSATLDLVPAEASDNCGIKTVSNDQADNTFDVGETIITWKATDVHGNESTAVQKITVINNEPVISSVAAAPSTVSINEEVTLAVAYADNNVKSASVNWGDLSAPDVLQDPASPFEVSHAYPAEGKYAVTVTITDQCDASASYVYENIIVVEKHSGSVKGDGWYYSKPGFYLKDRRSAGKAHFHFDAAFLDGSDVPAGKISFDFKDGKLSFKSTRLDMLEVDGQHAILLGSGKVNGKKDYRILIGMYDNGPGDEQSSSHLYDDKGIKDKHAGNGDHKADQIRVKIWDSHGSVVYDTQAGSSDDALASTELGGGRIDIQNSTFGDLFDDHVATYLNEDETSVYPNPFDDWMTVQFTSASKEDVNMQLLDLTGKVIFNKNYRPSDDNSYTLDLPEGKGGGGLYILKISQGRKVEFFRVLGK